MVSLFGSSNALTPVITDLARAQANLVPMPKPFTAADDSLATLDPSAAASSLLPTPPSFSPSFAPTQFGDLTKQFLTPAQAIQAPGRQPFMPISQPAAPAPTTQQGTGTTSLGGDWAGVDQWDAQIQSAAQQTGLDPDQIKAVMKVESDGNPGAQGSPGVGGLMQVNSSVWGNGPWQTDNAANILKGAQILKSYMDQNGGNFSEALRGYHGYGFDGNTTDQQYSDAVVGYYNQLKSGATAPTTTPQGAVGDNPAGLSVLNVALSYVGNAPYIWGAIPGKGDNPDVTGWDCSGMTYWLDQNYGNGQLPMGSHYQYQYAQQTGQLNTNLNALQPGDLVFIDTGWQEGAGNELNNAGHVAIYLGNGKIVQAANPSTGTVVSNLSSYTDGSYGTFLGSMHMPWSSAISTAPSQTRTSLGMASSPIEAANNWLASR